MYILKRIMPYLTLYDDWKIRILNALERGRPEQQDTGQVERLEHALERLRKQHLWGDLSDKEYRREREGLERRLKLVATPVQSHHLPNLETAAGLLRDLPALGLHPGVTDGQRETLVREVFRRITIDGKDFVSIEPKAEYVPLFAVIASGKKYDYREFDATQSPQQLNYFEADLVETGSVAWLMAA